MRLKPNRDLMDSIGWLINYFMLTTAKLTHASGSQFVDMEHA